MPPKRGRTCNKPVKWGEKKGRFIDDEPEASEVSEGEEELRVQEKKVSGLHKSTGGGGNLVPPPYFTFCCIDPSLYVKIRRSTRRYANEGPDP